MIKSLGDPGYANLVLAPVYLDSATTTTYTISAADSGKVLICNTATASIVITWPILSTGVTVAVSNIGANNVTNSVSGAAFDLTATTLAGSNTSAMFTYRSATAITNVGALT